MTALLCIAAEGKGGIAQLGERLHGMQEVSGSIPLTSTKLLFELEFARIWFFAFSFFVSRFSSVVLRQSVPRF